jgi:hypothetical protein
VVLVLVVAAAVVVAVVVAAVVLVVAMVLVVVIVALVVVALDAPGRMRSKRDVADVVPLENILRAPPPIRLAPDRSLPELPYTALAPDMILPELSYSSVLASPARAPSEVEANELDTELETELARAPNELDANELDTLQIICQH